MKKIIISLFASMMFLASCQKEEESAQIPEQTQQQEVEISLSIRSEFDDFVPDTKSQAQTVSRICWAGGESVYAYVIVPTPDDGDWLYVPSYAGTLTAAVEEGSDGRIAILSGTINRTPTDGKIFLLHSPLLSKAPSSIDGSIKISLATQGGTEIPFVAYAFVDYNSNSISNLKTKFTFATSVLYASVSGLRTDSRSVQSASIVGINTLCTLSFGGTDGSFNGSCYVSGWEEGTICREWYNPNYPNDKGTMGIYFAIPKSNSNKMRYLEIIQDAGLGMPNTLIGGKFATVALESGKTYLTHQACSNGLYIDGATNEQGIFVPSTGIWWSPVNCGYSSINTDGMLYQWGRRFPFSYTTTPSYKTTQATSVSVGNDESNRTYFYKGNTGWHSNSDTKDWQRAFDPCPAGWRVPTLIEFQTLKECLNSSWLNPGGYTLGAPRGSRSYSGTTSSVSYYWTATNDGTADGAYAYNGSQSSARYQAYGYRVRCVQD